MKKTNPIILIMIFGLSLTKVAFADTNLAQGEKLYKRSCTTCPGQSGEKSAMGESRIINNLTPQEIYTALSERKSGKIEGAGNRIKSQLSEEDIKNLSELVPTLKK